MSITLAFTYSFYKRVRRYEVTFPPFLNESYVGYNYLLEKVFIICLKNDSHRC